MAYFMTFLINASCAGLRYALLLPTCQYLRILRIASYQIRLLCCEMLKQFLHRGLIIIQQLVFVKFNYDIINNCFFQQIVT